MKKTKVTGHVKQDKQYKGRYVPFCVVGFEHDTLRVIRQLQLLQHLSCCCRLKAAAAAAAAAQATPRRVSWAQLIPSQKISYTIAFSAHVSHTIWVL
jgi:hypothetical protein